MVRLLLALAGVLLLAGCCQPSDAMGPQVRNPGMPAPDSDPPGNYVLARNAVVPGMPGILLQGEVLNDGQFHSFRVNATNAGGPMYLVPAGNCEPTWQDALETNGTRFNPRGRAGWLQCCAWKDFRHGDSLVASFEWNELMWDERNRHSAAPPGDYTWTALIPVLKAGQEPCVDEPAMGLLEIELTTTGREG